MAILLCCMVLPMRGAVDTHLQAHFCEPATCLFGCQPRSVSGVCYDTLQSVTGADSIVELRLSYGTPTASEQYRTICGGTYLFGCQQLSTSGTYYDYLTNASGCDSVATLHLMVATPRHTTLTDSIALGGIYLFGCSPITPTIAGITQYTDRLLSAQGCDSTVTLSLRAYNPAPVPSVVTTINDVTCGGTYLFGCMQLTQSGTYRDTLTNSNGQDSVTVLHLTVAEPKTITLTAKVTEGDTYLFGCKTVEATTVGTLQLSDTVTTIQGCDSIITLTLTVEPKSPVTPDSVVISETVCGGTYLFGCAQLTQSGTYRDTLTGSNGQDSVTVLHLTVAEPKTTTLTAKVTAGETYLFGCKTIEATMVGTLQLSDTLTTIQGCDSIITLTLTVEPKSPVVPDSVIISETICGGTYLFGCQMLTASGTYRDTLASSNGQDSVTVLHLTIVEPKTTTLTAKVTEGETYLFGCKTVEATTVGTLQLSDTLTTIQGCDSIINLTLTIEPKSPVTPDSVVVSETICGGTYLFGCAQLTQSGTYRDTLTNSNGQDSVTVLHLTIAAPKATATAATICEGDTLLFGCKALTLAGTYTDTLRTVEGCDSIITLTLSVNPVQRTTTEATICAGDSYTFMGKAYTEAGTYTDTTTSVLTGCDSIVTLTLYVQTPVTAPEESKTVCASELPYNWLDHYTVTTAGTYRDTAYYTTGCDSVYYTLHLTVNQPTAGDTTAVICVGDLPYTWHGQTLTQAGTATYTTTNVAGCDSVVTLTLTVNEPTTKPEEDVAICASELPYNWLDHYTVNKAGTYLDTAYYATGCDSVYYTLHLTVNQSTTGDTTATICQSELPYTWHGQTLTQAGTATYTTTNVAGCDSVVTLTLTVNEPTTTPEEQVVICASELPYTWLDHYTVTTAGTYRDTAYYATGCDSVYYTLHLTVNQPTTGDTTATICAGDLPYTWHGQTLTQAGTATYTTTNVAGCDSVVTLTLVVNQPTTGDTTATICQSDLPYTWHGQTLTQAGTATYTTTNVAGCDSVVTLTLTVNECLMRIETHVTDTVCAGTVYEGRLSTYTIDALTTWTDSVRATVDGTPTDSVFYYTVMPYTFTLPNPAIVELRAICGMAVNTADATAAISAFVSAEPLYAPNVTVTWEIQTAGGTTSDWHTLTTADTVRGDMEQVYLRYSITTDCGTLTSDTYTVVVERATADNVPSMDNVPAVSKYSDQLLMINLRAIEAAYGWNVREEEVTWYRMAGTTIDPQRDEQTGKGYYYTVGNQLRGSYYAVIDHEWQDGDIETSHCGGLLRTVLLVCGTEQGAPRLLPTVARPLEEIRVLNLDPEKTTEIRVYSADGKLLDTCTEQAATEYTFHAAGTAGVYMVDVRTEDTSVTLRYIVKQ